MIKKLLVVFVAIFTMSCFAQEGTASPYSFYGIGSLKFKGTVENRSMGGLSIYTDSIHINLRNPASFAGKNLSSFDRGSRPVKYTVGGSYSSTNLKNRTTKSNTSSTTFDYLAIALPVGKFGVGFGIMPFTSVGYKLEKTNAEGIETNRFQGEGGLNKVFVGLGYLITDNLSVGVDVNYNFGNIQNSALEYRFDNDGLLLQRQSRENNRSDLSGLNVNLGVTYKRMLNENLQLISGATYTPKSNLTSRNERSFSTVVINTSDLEIPRGTVNVDLEAIGLEETDLVLPSKFSIGAGIGKPRKWFAGAEFTSLKISEFENPLYTGINNTTYEDGYIFSLGGFYIPKYNSFSGYQKRIVYRFGSRIEKTGLNMQNKSIYEFGTSFGVGLPIGTFFSNANVGIEIGKRGTTSSNLIQENFVNLQISLSLNDRWFKKRKFD